MAATAQVLDSPHSLPPTVDDLQHLVARGFQAMNRNFIMLQALIDQKFGSNDDMKLEVFSLQLDRENSPEFKLSDNVQQTPNFDPGSNRKEIESSLEES